MTTHRPSGIGPGGQYYGQGAFAFLFQRFIINKNPPRNYRIRARRNGMGSTFAHHFMSVRELLKSISNGKKIEMHSC